jgi:predicted porin
VGIVRNGKDGTTTLSPASNGLNQLAFSGSEDLGGGLKANFVLQQRFNPTNGNNDGTNAGRRTFQGASTVGLSGGFGNVRLGREIEAYSDVNNWADPWGTSRAASIAFTNGNAALGPDGADLGRTEGIHYNSPSFGGVSLGLTYGFKDQTSAQVGGGNAATATPFMANKTKSFFSGNVMYSGGPFTAFIGYMQNRYDDKAWALGGGYNLGVAHIKVAYTDVNSRTGGSVANVDEYSGLQLAVDVPLGATVLSAGYLRDKTNDVKSHKLGLGAQYNLSKRTAFITTYGKRKATKANFDFSLRHTF